MNQTLKTQNKTELGTLVSELAQVHNELWEQEDHARSNVDSQVVLAKRQIDKLNQRRNDIIEQIDAGDQDSDFEIILKSMVPPIIDSFASVMKTQKALLKFLPCF